MVDALRQAWLHVLLQRSCNSSDISRIKEFTMDKLLQIVGLNSKDEYRALDIQLRNTLSQLNSVSFLSTLSSQELSPFYGVIGIEEEELLDHVIRMTSNQFLTKDDSNLVKLLEALGHTAGDSFTISELSPLFPFIRSTEVLLSIGGDDRLTINFTADKLNKYLSSTVPRVDMINRGSCTCSTITMENYLLADRVRSQFVLSVLESASHSSSPDRVLTATQKLFQSAQSQLISKLRSTLGLSANEEDAQVVLFPSGSDAEFLPLIAALVRSYRLAGGDASQVRVVNYVCAAGEVGRYIIIKNVCLFLFVFLLPVFSKLW